MPERVIAIGDIHGSLRALDKLLHTLNLQPGDQLVTLGDYVDRGPDSRGVLDRMISLHESGQVIPLRGNHELMMLRARDSIAEERFWRYYGGEQALASYAPPFRPGRLNDVPETHWRFMAVTCRDYFETDTHIFVHGGVHPQFPLHEQDEDSLFWRPLSDRGPHVSGKIVVCGHSEQRNGSPRDLYHTIGIDTWAYGGGWLTGLDVASGQFWQANEDGETRIGQL
jgi:serine/threonine protein phosphatase 1